MNTKNIALLKEIAQSHEKRVRSDGSPYYVFTHDKAFGTIGICGDEFILDPFNECTYEWVGLALQDVIDAVVGGRDPHEEILDIADRITDVYTSDLVRWLGMNCGNVEYLTEAMKNGVTDGFKLLQVAQRIHIEEVLNTLAGRVHELIEEPEEVQA